MDDGQTVDALPHSIPSRQVRGAFTTARLSCVAALLFCMTTGVPFACAQKKKGADVKPGTPQVASASEADQGTLVVDDEPERGLPESAAWLEAIEVGKAFSTSSYEAIADERWQEAHDLLSSQELIKKEGEHHGLLARAYAALRADRHEACLKDVNAALEMSALSAFKSDLASWGVSCAHALERHAEVARLANFVDSSHPSHERALYLLGDALVEAGSSTDLEQAEKIFAAYLELYPRSSNSELVRFAYARRLEARGKPSQAAELYNDMITYHPLSNNVPLALKEVKRLKPKISKAASARISASTDTQRLNKLRALFARHRSEEVVEDGKRYLKGFKKGSESYCETQYLMGKSLTKLRQHTDSIAHYEDIIKRCSDKSWLVKAYYLAGRGLWNAGKRAEARDMFEKLWKAFPSHSYADDAMLYAAKIEKSEGNTKSMRSILKEQLKKYPNGDMMSDAQWLLMQDLFLKEDYQEVIDFARESPEAGKESLYTRGRLDYFAGRAAEKLGKEKDARAFYEKVSVEHPLGYYALLAVNRQAKMAGLEEGQDICTIDSGAICDRLVKASKKSLEEKGALKAAIEIPKSVEQADAFKRGGVFLRLGMHSLAEREFHALSAKLSESDEALWSLAMLLDAAKAYPFSHDITRRKIEGWEVGYPVANTTHRWTIAYPRPFFDEISSWAKKREIPSQVVWAIMREESGFNPRVESWANAKGLLQLMDSTAEKMARKDEMKDFTASKLFEVDNNLRLGTAYIKELSDTFDAHPALIIAGYNGGSGNVNNWLTKNGAMELDMWVEEIPYGQTRNYTKRVLTSFWTYHWLYAKKGAATPVLPFTLPPAS